MTVGDTGLGFTSDAGSIAFERPEILVPREEFLQRQDSARAKAAVASLDGLVVYSRGGSAVDMHPEVFYLTNHYSPHPYFGDHQELGTARSHAVSVLPVDGPAILIVDGPWWRPDLVVADDVRAASDINSAVGKALRDSGLMGNRIGLVGTSFMSAAAYLGLQRHVGSKTTLVVADMLIEELRRVKSRAELEILRRGAIIGSRAVDAMMAAVQEGNREVDAVRAAADVIVGSGAVMYDMPTTSGRLAHHFLWSRLPTYDAYRSLERGDWFHADCYGAYGGYLWDFGRTTVVGGDPGDDQLIVLEASAGLVEHLAAIVKPGMTAGEVHRNGMEWLSEAAAGTPLALSEDESPVLGHGLGLGWESPWLRPNEEIVLEPGMYLALEGFLGAEGVGGVFHEDNGLVTSDGFETWSTARSRWW
ncbi:MAG: Xaa-Pro peptidase family protein [bacterium]|nr:Xaa-Pro peptidase family protein [bacterium]MDE0287034.1 Xaa-Pro peptidase family protein [bacterium]MDE0440466.1 Xaa-Pro peptidase family protein [bacterium]